MKATPVPVPNRTMAMQVTEGSAEAVLKWTEDWTNGFSNYGGYVDRAGGTLFVALGPKLSAWDTDWVVIDFLTGKVRIVHSGPHAQALGLEEA